ncbi:hypothetical protein [Bradyrhizobium sp.]
MPAFAAQRHFSTGESDFVGEIYRDDFDRPAGLAPETRCLTVAAFTAARQ